MMRYLFSTILMFWLLNSCLYALAQTPAFPGAEGFGRFTQGGRGGRVIEVTNLNESGPGSLAAALQASGPRIIVFRVGGTINLPLGFEITNPYWTIAGQTAPGDGIMITGSGLYADYAGANGIIRHIRIRNGPNGDTRESLSLKGGPYMVDHVSTAWATDDQVFLWFGHDVTVQWSIVSEQIGVGGNMSSNSDGTTFHHNLVALGGARMPLVGDRKSDVVNNVTYWKLSPGVVSPSRACTFSNWIGNYAKRMPSTVNDYAGILFYETEPFANCSQAYVQGNLSTKFREEDTLPQANAVTRINGNLVQIVGTRFNYPQVTTTSAAQAYIDVLAKAGATFPRRDAVDERVVSLVKSGTAFQGTQGAIITDPAQVGGWPVLNSGTPPADTDHDGMPDTWETTNGFNPNNAADGPLDADGDGYTNVEEYLNSIVDGPTLPVASTPTLSVSATSVNARNPVTVMVANGPGNLTDWVGLYLASAADTSWLDWQYLSGSKTTPSTGLAAATLTFTMPATAGTYQFRFFANNGYTRLAISPNVTVTGPTPPVPPTNLRISWSILGVLFGFLSPIGWVLLTRPRSNKV